MANAKADKAADGVQPREIEAGANVVRASYIAAESHSATDVIQCIKIPSGAIIDEVALAAPISGSAPAIVVLSLGDGDDPNRFGTFTVSTAQVVARAQYGIGYQYSLSDAADPFYDTIDATVDSNVLTVSQGFALTVTYHCDD